jgi:phosphoenolpyruvate carboxylase
MGRGEIEQEVRVFIAWRDSALELGLQNAATVLTEQISARKQALTKFNPQRPEKSK